MTSRFKPVGYRVKVRPEKVEEVSKGGIIVATGETKKLEQAAQVRGTVLEVSPVAYLEYIEKGLEPWCKVGDVVLYQKHAGMRVLGDDGKPRDDELLLNDTDITAVRVDE
jgi:co-chaperonin GroES (HSP10)